MITKILYPVFFLLIAVSASGQNQIAIKGQVINQPSIKRIYFTEDFNGTEIKDSANIVNGKFVFQKVPEYGFPVLNFIYVGVEDEHKVMKRKLLADFFMESGNTEIKITGLEFRAGAQITGSKTTEHYGQYKSDRESYLQNRQKRNADPNYVPLKGQAARDDYMEGLRQVGTGFVMDHPDSYFSLFLLEKDLSSMSTPDQLADLFAALDPALQKSEKGQDVLKNITSAAKVKVGTLAPDFIELDSLGKEVKLSDFKGQYVLIDFWASWCKPCRAENPYLLQAYAAYQNKNFTILGVSLDKSRKAWLDAVKQDGLPWHHVSSLNPQKAESALKYGVTSIPRNFLIDPTGKIIAMDLRGHELESRLPQLIK
ncbi:MAG: AhpC/TSA family protein [Sphingobacterium sp.]|jgi:thiol-disulfide isomerase/thioredoxin|nr:AhpC/TSA family protein [Sphingobacterium sp.]